MGLFGGFFGSFFGGSRSRARRAGKRRGGGKLGALGNRRLLFDALEERRLLSVVPMSSPRCPALRPSSNR